MEISILNVLAQILSWHTTHFIIGETSCSIFVLLLSIALFLVHHTIQTHLVLVSHETHIRHLSLIVTLIIGILHLVLLIVILLLLLSSLRCLLAIALSIRLIIHWVLWVLSNGQSRLLQLVLLLLSLVLRVRILIILQLLLIERVVLQLGMSLQVLHVLVNVYDLLLVLVHLTHEGLNGLGEFRELLLDDGFVLLEMLLDVSEELLEVLLVIQDQLVNDSFVKLITGKFIRISLDYDRGHVGEVFRNLWSACLHYIEVLVLNLLQ